MKKYILPVTTLMVMAQANVVASDTFETEHPYGNNENITQEICVKDGYTGPSTLTITGELENNYDTLTILGKKYTGVLNKNISIPSECVTVEFDSDYSVTKEGVVVKIEADNAVNPDYEFVFMMDKTHFSEPSSFSMLIRVSELNGGLNEGKIIFNVLKSPNMTLELDNSLTTMMGKTLNNDKWEMLDETLSTYRIKYIGTDSVFPANTRMYIGLSGYLIPEAHMIGSFVERINLLPGTGDTTLGNNTFHRTISY